jgi:hypothetical protein
VALEADRFNRNRLWPGWALATVNHSDTKKRKRKRNRTVVQKEISKANGQKIINETKTLAYVQSSSKGKNERSLKRFLSNSNSPHTNWNSKSKQSANKLKTYRSEKKKKKGFEVQSRIKVAINK